MHGPEPDEEHCSQPSWFQVLHGCAQAAEDVGLLFSFLETWPDGDPSSGDCLEQVINEAGRYVPASSLQACSLARSLAHSLIVRGVLRAPSSCEVGLVRMLSSLR